MRNCIKLIKLKNPIFIKYMAKKITVIIIVIVNINMINAILIHSQISNNNNNYILVVIIKRIKTIHFNSSRIINSNINHLQVMYIDIRYKSRWN